MDRAQLLKGTTTLLILAVLRDDELHGYEIAQRIRERSLERITPAEGWLYPALHRLEAQGMLEGTWRDGLRGPRRRYYRLTRDGATLLDEHTEAWESFALSVRLVTRPAASNG